MSNIDTLMWRVMLQIRLPTMVVRTNPVVARTDLMVVTTSPMVVRALQDMCNIE